MRNRTFLALGSLLLAAGICAAAASGQASSPDPRHVDATQFGERVILGPNWLFAAGDNPAWAAPDFDDSGWGTISTDKQLLDYGIRYIPSAWYRLHVHVRPGTHNLMVGTWGVNGRYEVYVDGVRIGGKGGMTGRVGEGQRRLLAFAVPDGLVKRQGDFVLAIRVMVNPGTDAGRGTSTPLYSGSVFLISPDAATLGASYVAAHSAGTSLLACGLALVVCLISFALFSALRSNREYMAIGIFMLAASFAGAISAVLSLVNYTDFLYIILFAAVAVENFALIEFVRLVLHLRRTRWLLALEVVSSLAFILDGSAVLGIYPDGVVFLAFFLPVLLAKIVLPVLLVRGSRRGNREATLLLPAIFLGCFADYWNFIINVASMARLNTLLPYLGFNVHIGSYNVDLWRLGDFAFYLAVLLFLVLRTVRIARERASAAAELEAARTVQHVLIPEEIPIIPGFLLHSVYKPAGRVGGDFFQILPMKNGGVLAVIGDVSGKGMPAAMTVSLLVGTVRTLAHYTQSPGEILAAMNQRMLARSSGGFTTCLVLRADVDGTLTVANAGHIAPYVGGKELPLENGLPLGLAADAVYVESTFALGAGEQVTLLTDGVVEARDGTGALFGFDRTAAISTRPAEAIAQAAQAFGQDDDITALTLQMKVPA